MSNELVENMNDAPNATGVADFFEEMARKYRAIESADDSYDYGALSTLDELGGMLRVAESSVFGLSEGDLFDPNDSPANEKASGFLFALNNALNSVENALAEIRAEYPEL